MKQTDYLGMAREFFAVHPSLTYAKKKYTLEGKPITRGDLNLHIRRFFLDKEWPQNNSKISEVISLVEYLAWKESK